MHLTRGKMLQDITVCLGGRIAESIACDDVTTGAVQDIRQATDSARDMVTKYGFSDELGMINYSTSDDEVFIGRDIGHTKNFSEGTAEAIDREVKKIIDGCHAKATAILQENKDVLERLAELLIEKERIGQEEFESLFEQNDGVTA
jgi:cell division protease FtsH